MVNNPLTTGIESRSGKRQPIRAAFIVKRLSFFLIGLCFGISCNFIAVHNSEYITIKTDQFGDLRMTIYADDLSKLNWYTIGSLVVVDRITPKRFYRYALSFKKKWQV